MHDAMFIFSSDGKLSSTPWYGQIGKFNSMFKSRTGKEVRSTSSRLSVWYIVVNILIQVGVFVNSVPARVRMTVCDSGNLNFQNSSAGSDNQLSHEDLQELNLKPGENKARWSKLTLSKKARKIICSFNLIFTAQISTNCIMLACSHIWNVNDHISLLQICLSWAEDPLPLLRFLLQLNRQADHQWCRRHNH